MILVSLVEVVLAMRRPSCPQRALDSPGTRTEAGGRFRFGPVGRHNPAHRISGRVGEHPRRNPALPFRRNTLPAVSTLWTPGGEHPVGPATGAQQDPPTEERRAPGSRPPAPRPADTGNASSAELDPDELSPEEQQQMMAHLEELRHQLVSTPAEVVVANHAYGLFELAAIHLSQTPPRLDDARLAVDAMAGLVEALAGRLGEPERSLRDALSQIRLAFVQISAKPEGTADMKNSNSQHEAPKPK